MKKSSVILIFLLVLLPIIVALENPLEISIQNTDNLIVAGTESIFNLNIKNNGIRDQTLTITPDKLGVFPLSEIFDYILIEPSQVTIKSHQEKTIEIRVKTLPNLPKEGRYENTITIKSITDETLQSELQLSMGIIPPEKSVNIQMDIESQIIPGKPTPYQLILKNRGNIELTNLDVKIKSDFYTEEFKVDILGKDSTLIKDLILTANPTSQEGESNLNIEVLQENLQKGSLLKQLTLTLNPDIQEERIVNKQFLATTIKIIKRNQGNSEVFKKIKYPVGSGNKLFTSTIPQAKLVEEYGREYYIWEFTLQPDNQFEVQIKNDYRVIFVIILFILFSTGLYAYFRNRSVLINKRVFRIKSDKEGVSQLKILLHLKNRTLKEIHHLKVKDFLPSSVKLHDDFGTLKPSKIEQNEKGVRLTWEVLTLEPGEERIIPYKVDTKLHSLGKLLLPNAVVQFREKNNKETENSSNKLTIYAPKDEQHLAE